MTARSTNARIAVQRSWANTPDRTARTRNGRNAGPAGLDWHLARLDPVRFAEATDAQRLVAAESARKAHFASMAVKSAAARRITVDSDPTPPHGIVRPLGVAS